MELIWGILGGYVVVGLLAVFLFLSILSSVAEIVGSVLSVILILVIVFYTLFFIISIFDAIESKIGRLIFSLLLIIASTFFCCILYLGHSFDSVPGKIQVKNTSRTEIITDILFLNMNSYKKQSCIIDSTMNKALVFDNNGNLKDEMKYRSNYLPKSESYFYSSDQRRILAGLWENETYTKDVYPNTMVLIEVYNYKTKESYVVFSKEDYYHASLGKTIFLEYDGRKLYFEKEEEYAEVQNYLSNFYDKYYHEKMGPNLIIKELTSDKFRFRVSTKNTEREYPHPVFASIVRNNYMYNYLKPRRYEIELYNRSDYETLDTCFVDVDDKPKFVKVDEVQGKIIVSDDYKIEPNLKIKGKIRDDFKYNIFKKLSL